MMLISQDRLPEGQTCLQYIALYMPICVCTHSNILQRVGLDSCIPARSLSAKESEKYIPCGCRRHSRPTKELLCAHSKTIQLS